VSANIPAKYRIKATDELVTRFVAVEDLHLEAPNWINPRTMSGLDRLALQKLGESILADGPKVPLRVQKVIVTSEEDGLPVEVDLVIDGQRRTRAAQIVCPPGHLLPVVDIISPDAIELTEEVADVLLDDSLVTMDREPISSYEQVEVAARLKARGRTGAEIGARLHRSPSWVSKMLAAWGRATDKLKASFRKGEITDEMFKDLATETDASSQTAKVDRVLEARAAGDKTEARTRAKEAKAEAKLDKALDAPGADFTRPREQREMFVDKDGELMTHGKPGKVGELPPLPDKPKAPKPDRIPVAPRAALEDLLATLEKRKSSSDYVSGLRDGMRFALGVATTDDFAKAFHEYIARLDGAPVAKKAPKKGKR
jgi:ParB-like chromosome segregation protein Spo0J